MGKGNDAMSQALRISLIFALTAIVGCTSGSDCSFENAELTETGLSIEQSCSELNVTLVPEVKIADTWQSGTCTKNGDTLSCSISGLGQLHATITDGDAELMFHAESDVEVAGLRWFGQGTIPGADTVLSNGFQSWSHSGLLSIGGAIGDNQLMKALGSPMRKRFLSSPTNF